MAYHTIHIHHNDGMRTESILAFPPHIFRVVPVPCLMAKKSNPIIYADNVLLLLAGMNNSTVLRAVVTVMVVARSLI